jgi:hypothetical protein
MSECFPSLSQALGQLGFVKVFKNDLLKAALQTGVVGKELVVHVILADKWLETDQNGAEW